MAMTDEKRLETMILLGGPNAKLVLAMMPKVDRDEVMLALKEVEQSLSEMKNISETVSLEAEKKMIPLQVEVEKARFPLAIAKMQNTAIAQQYSNSDVRSKERLFSL